MNNLPSHIEINGKHYCDAYSPNKDNINYECIIKNPNKEDIKQINKKINFNIPENPTILPNGKIYCLTDDTKNKCLHKTKKNSDNNIIEGFNNENRNNINIFLKAILFSLLYFVLIHKNTRDFIVKQIKIDKNNYISMSMLIFIVIYFIVNLFIS